MTGKDKKIARRRKHFKLLLGVIAGAMVLGGIILYSNNNVSMMDEEQFSRRVDVGIARAREWLVAHRAAVVKKKNVPLMRMLQYCDELQHDPLYEGIVDEFVQRPARGSFQKRLIDANHPISATELNRTIRQSPIDVKWMLYALDPEKAELTEEEHAGMWDGDKWGGRVLTHQLWAFIHLPASGDPEGKRQEMITYLSKRIAGQLRSDMAVVDIYIQKIAFVMLAGHGELISQRWIERVLKNQGEDGGWNDRWMWFWGSRWRPYCDLATPASDQHATIQGLWLLYQVKYRYGEQFGLAGTGEQE